MDMNIMRMKGRSKMMRTIKVTGKGKIAVKPEFSIEYTVADVEKCKNKLLHKAIEDSIQKAQALTTAANVKLGEIQEVDGMLSSIYYGEIQSDKLVSWNENKDLYNILVENNRVYKLGGWEFLDIANKLFDNEKQVDWGSYAYQCTKEQLEKLMEQTGCEIDKMNELASEKIYGIVFVEEV